MLLIMNKNKTEVVQRYVDLLSNSGFKAVFGDSVRFPFLGQSTIRLAIAIDSLKRWELKRYDYLCMMLFCERW